jgi:hypothetical protein
MAYGWNPCSTSDILECIDPAEYAALVDAAKDGLRMILSCGTVSMYPGSKARTWLFQIFPSGVTYNALMAKFADIPGPPHP